MASTRDAILERIKADQEAWSALVAEVPAGRMAEPGPMGDWSFHDLVSHLLRWRLRSLARLDAARVGEARPANPWPTALSDDDPINAWFRDQDAGRSSSDLLAEYAGSFARLSRAVEALPAEVFVAESSTDGYFRWRDANGELESDFSGHLADHADDVRAWLARS
jgi:hypothetical protein